MWWWISPVLALSVVSAAQAQELQCTVASKFICSQSTGCLVGYVEMWSGVDLKRGTISRCDPKGCNIYPAQFNTSGNYVNISLPQGGYMAKMSLDGSQFSEVATIGGTVLLSFGSCSPR